MQILLLGGGLLTSPRILSPYSIIFVKESSKEISLEMNSLTKHFGRSQRCLRETLFNDTTRKYLFLNGRAMLERISNYFLLCVGTPTLVAGQICSLYVIHGKYERIEE